MTGNEAAGLWIGLNILLLIFLSARVGQARVRFKINLGDGGNPEMLRAIRAHANYTEYAPAALLGLVSIAWLGAGATVIHALGAAFFLARISHLLGLGMGVWEQGRVIGTALTMLTLLATSATLIYYALA